MQTKKNLKLSDYEQTVTLGTGSFGRVKLAKHKKTGKFYAAKIMKKAEIMKLKQVDHIKNESTIMMQLNHPFITGMEGFTQDDRYLYLILEFVKGGELFTYLRGKGKFEGPQTQFYAA
jgi:serine/threonine protein kinase